MEEVSVNPEALNTASSGDPRTGRTWRRLSARCHRRIFPVDVGICCPCLCSSWRRIKDWLHLVLILGVLCTLVCVVLQIVEITSDMQCYSPLCIRQWFSALVVLPSVYEFIKFIHGYDESLQEHQQKAEEEVHNLIETINKQVVEMQVLCSKLTENATDFAHRTFSDKREQFERFILDVKHYYKDLYTDPEILEQLRRFVKKWLRVFGQSLLDPEPLFKGLEEEMNACNSITELCEKVTGRLTKIKETTRIQMVPSDSYMINHPQPRSRRLGLTDTVVDENGLLEPPRPPTSPSSSSQKCGVSWVHFGCSGRIGRDVARTRDGDFTRSYPQTVHFCFGTLTVLSRRHLNFLFYLLADTILIAVEGASAQVWSMLLVIANGLCVVSTLACFEQIDEIAQLQRKIDKYTQRQKEVAAHHQQANENYDKILQLQDLWNYRTQPFLGIMCKVHRALEEKDRQLDREGPGIQGDQRVDWFKLANESIEALDLKLGPIQDWKMPEKQWKETVGRQLKGAEHHENVEELIGMLPILTADLRSLECHGAGASSSGSFSRGPGPSLSSPRSSPRTAPAV